MRRALGPEVAADEKVLRHEILQHTDAEFGHW
jgi:hypothetical protein